MTKTRPTYREQAQNLLMDAIEVDHPDKRIAAAISLTHKAMRYVGGTGHHPIDKTHLHKLLLGKGDEESARHGEELKSRTGLDLAAMDDKTKEKLKKYGADDEELAALKR